MKEMTVYSVGQYGHPFTQTDRNRTIAALYVTQGAATLGYVPMRRDMLTYLMSPSAVNYWLNTKGWFEHCGNAGKVQLLRLTPAGMSKCGTLSGPSVGVRGWMKVMLDGSGAGSSAKTFAPLSFSDDA